MNRILVSFVFVFATAGFARSAPAYLVSGNPALDEAATAAGFAYMPVSMALEKKESDTMLCYYTATYEDRLLTLFNLLDDNLPEKPAAAEKKRVESIRAAAWRVKRGALSLQYFCGIQNSWPPEWNVPMLKRGDRKAFAVKVDEVDAALDELKKLIYDY